MGGWGFGRKRSLGEQLYNFYEVSPGWGVLTAAGSLIPQAQSSRGELSGGSQNFWARSSNVHENIKNKLWK